MHSSAERWKVKKETSQKEIINIEDNTERDGRRTNIDATDFEDQLPDESTKSQETPC